MSVIYPEKLFEYLFFLAIFNFLITIAEFFYDYFKKNKRDFKDDASNVVIGIIYELLERFAITSIGFTLLYLFHQRYHLLTFDFSVSSWLLAILAADFTYYWMHRTEHKFRILWAYHSVHHSSLQFNMLTGYRLSWLEGFFEWVFLIPMILVGFSPIQSIVSLSFVALYQHWIHTQKINKMGPLEGLINTPSAHRVHHASNSGYINKNFGGILLIWDRLFKTYQDESFVIIYGIGEKVSANNPLKIQFHEYLKLWKNKWPINLKKNT